MSTRVGEGDNWQTKPAFGQSSGQEGAPALQISVEAVCLDFDSDVLYERRIESFPVQNQGG